MTQPHKNLKIPFGVKDNRLVGIEDVPAGISCGCHCPSCGGRLQARKGRERVHHFSHDPKYETACEHAVETSIHLMAKQIFTEQSGFSVPKLEISVSDWDMGGMEQKESVVVIKEGWWGYERALVESQHGDIRPDVVLCSSTESILVEIAVTHFVDGTKREWIRKHKLTAIEIDLSHLVSGVTKEQLSECLIQNTDRKKWLSFKQALEVKTELKQRLDKKIDATNEAIVAYRNQLADERRPRKERTTAPLQTGIAHAPHPSPMRWFYCENCRFTFEVLASSVAPNSGSVNCERCGHQVSTNLPRYFSRHKNP